MIIIWRHISVVAIDRHFVGQPVVLCVDGLT